MADLEAIRAKRNAIENELKRLGWWQAERPAEDAFQNMVPFGMATLAFSQWLQFVLIERVDVLLAGDGDWPSSSAVGVHAVREYDGLDEAGPLVDLLCEWDALFE